MFPRFDKAKGAVMLMPLKLQCRRAGPLAVFLSLAMVATAGPASATIRYEVSLTRPAQHILHVSMAVPNASNHLILQMAAWDALYQIRDFAQRVTEFHATSATGAFLPVTRVDKETWRVDAGSSGDQVRVEYAIYWDDAGPFGTQLNAQHAFLNLAMVLCYLPDRRTEDVIVHFSDVPPGWHIAEELPLAKETGGDDTTYAAIDFDHLADAPVEAGKFDTFSLQLAGKTIRVVQHGDTVDHTRFADLVTRIVNYETAMMGEAPFPEYTFLFHIGRDFGGGGMEHANSAAIAVQSEDQLPNVTAHEFFHLWNVKRIRPQSLEPLDRTREMYTKALWFAEGVTDAYGAYVLVRTGLWSKAQFLADLGATITQLQASPARAFQSVEESSLDAWYEKYGLYERPEFSISYYGKGHLLGLLLDVVIRDATDNRASLDEVMRRMNQKFAHAGRFYADSEDVRTTAEEVLRGAGAGPKANLSQFFQDYVAGTSELPYNDLLAAAGLRVVQRGQTRNGANAYAVEELSQPTERQQRILNGLLQGTLAAGSPGGNAH
jgi:predicted metalloprotease with PDZ domain